jgi:phosphotransferase system enzyme I (PtsI)
MAEIHLKGIAASPGLARGPAYLWREPEISFPALTGCQPEEERQRLVPAIIKAKNELKGIRISLENEGLNEEAQVFQAQSMMLDDPTLHQQVESELAQGVNIEAAWMTSVEALAEQLSAIPDPTFAARATDLRDVGKRVLCILLGVESSIRIELDESSILLARDLCPSETATLEKSRVLGFCTEEGGATSHTAILAKSLGIPAVVGIAQGLMDISPRTELIIDGQAGIVIVEPSEESLMAFETKKSAWQAQNSLEKKDSGLAAVTLDGHQVEVVANVGSLTDAATALDLGAEGIGLLRTEFLFLDRKSAPSEEEQYQAYSEILDLMGERPVVVRTIDVGGDKPIPYLDLGVESNPFLGYRAIRMCLDELDFFKTQLRALLRAGADHDLRIMFPMVSSIDEVLQAKQIVEETTRELKDANLQYAEAAQVGIMVEIPSVAIMADQFAEVVDFFSIGTNDLTQYTFAVDRTNPRVARMGDPCHPAVIRQIKQVIEAAHVAGIWVGLCGEMAGDPEAVPILLGLGLDEFSMSATLIPHAKAVLRKCNYSDAQQLASDVLQLPSSKLVREAAREFLNS